jgi:hypothetical protein
MSAPSIAPAEHDAATKQSWPIFICYRQVDGLPAAKRLHELLDKYETKGPDDKQIRLDVYLDQTMPAVADWRELHRPYLEKARALIVVCSPGAKVDEGENDWVNREINWWIENRGVPPILIDPLRQGLRYVPSAIIEKWGTEQQRIALVETEWASLAADERTRKSDDLRRQIVATILPAGKAIWQQELDEANRRAAQLRQSLMAVVALLAAVLCAAGYAVWQRSIAETNRLQAESSARAAEVSRRVSEASLFDAQAAADFAEARSHEAKWETARQRQLEIKRALSALPSDVNVSIAARKQNLEHESRQLAQVMNELAAKAKAPRQRGYAQLILADESWRTLQGDGHSDAAKTRRRPEPPYIFSIELLNAGRGESILVHYGTPDATTLVMINGGSREEFARTVEARLRVLKEVRFAGAPTPIELFIASDQDADKIDGLVRLMRSAAEADRVADVRRVWANVFASQGLRGELRRLLEASRILRNDPFDNLVMRRDTGRTSVSLPGGLEIVVLAPEREKVEALYEFTRRRERALDPARAVVPSIEAFPYERFSRLEAAQDAAALPAPTAEQGATCHPSQNAERLARVALVDASVPNLASTVLLFRFRGKTFLHTGDSRADLIAEGLASAGLIGSGGRAHVDLLHLPHYASENNLSEEFLQTVTADEYLFSGDGTHGNPEIATIAALIKARPCARFVMNFVNRDGVAVRRGVRRSSSEEANQAIDFALTHGEKLDAFFAAEEQYNPRYRRVFRATDQGSVVIDLLDRLTY